MGIRVALNHRTCYRYPKPVWLSPHVVRLRPAPHCRTTIASYSLKVTPVEHFVNWQQDPYSNRLARLVFPKKTTEFSVEVDLIADLTITNPFDFFLEKDAEHYPFKYDPTLTRELAPYLEAAEPGPRLRDLIREVRREKLRIVDYLVELNQILQQRIKYVIRMEPGIQAPEETLALRKGSCRDTGWLLVQLLRHLGLASRFASGYLIQLAPDVKALDGPSGTAHDVSDLHAWAEVFLPGGGWIGLDPTSGLFTGEGHIPLACSADPMTAAPISGYFAADDESVVTANPDEPPRDKDGVRDKFEFSISVVRIHEDPRVTKPYSDEQWREIEALGHRVDADLKANDVRLTMGGEPTFVSVEDIDGAEWNTTALGPTKYGRADALLRRLRERFAPSGLLHHGQGKWYPGESLPRWALGLYWRGDGEPIWRDPSLVADESAPAGLPSGVAQTFISELAERLGVNPRQAVAGYEDVWYYLWKERRLPVNIDPLDSKLSNAEDRARLAKVFEQGLEKIVGYALPLRRAPYADDPNPWLSGAWFLRSERMYLVPGDSPMGYRLPLDSIPWVSESEYPYLYEQDPFEDRAPLRDRSAMSRQLRIPGVPTVTNPQGFVAQALETDLGGRRLPRRARPADLPPAQGESAPWTIRTQHCALRCGMACCVCSCRHSSISKITLSWSRQSKIRPLIFASPSCLKDIRRRTIRACMPSK